jgi:fructosamine-3-kinase
MKMSTPISLIVFLRKKMMNGLPHDIVKDLQETLGLQVLESQFLSGGCINPAVKLVCAQQTYFLKWNDAQAFPHMFEKEKQGLTLLADTKTVRIPHVIMAGQVNGTAYLLLEFIAKGYGNDVAWATFGSQLAHMHQHSHLQFGLDTDNYIGSLPQCNTRHVQWSDFFIQERLMPLVKRGRDQGKIPTEIQMQFEKLYKILPDLIPENEKPSLLHGDLWSGNVLMCAHQQPCIFDPAVYYGHREAELAYTHLFDRFPPSFYHAYEEAFPLEKEAGQRIDLFNLYPLLVHVNLFGGGYISQVRQILATYL